MKRVMLIFMVFLMVASFSFSKTVLKAGITTSAERSDNVTWGNNSSTGSSDLESAFTGNLEFSGNGNFEFGLGFAYETEPEDENGLEQGFAVIPAYALIRLFLGESVYIVGRGGISYALLNDEMENFDNEFGMYFGGGIGAEFGALQIEGAYTVSEFDVSSTLNNVEYSNTVEYSKICATVGFVF